MRGLDVDQIGVARPATEGPNKGVRDAGGVGCCGRANPETVTGIVPLYAGGCQGRAKPVSDVRTRQGYSGGEAEERARCVPADGEVTREGVDGE